MKIFNTVISLVLIVFISGCGGAAPIPVKKKEPTPQWVNGILPNDTATQLYGLGQAKNRDAAIKVALNDMVSRLGVSVESSYKSHEKVENYHLSSKITTDIKADVSKTKVNNYKVIKSFKVSYNEFAVMIETDKLQFISGLKDTLNTKKESISQKQKALKNQDILTKYNGKKALAKEASQLLSTVLMIAELDKSFDKTASVSFIQSVEKDFLAQANDLKFYVSGDKNSQNFIAKIKNYLAQSGFHVVDRKNSAVTIQLSTSSNISNGTVAIAVLKVNITVHDRENRVGGKSLIIKERFTNMQSVYKNAAIHFEQDIKERGINEVLGMNLDIDTNY